MGQPPESDTGTIVPWKKFGDNKVLPVGVNVGRLGESAYGN